jgi:UDP-N-acetylglucosamine diphosphorylase/glucosamine-1-phosphate N-acetyltransferase
MNYILFDDQNRNDLLPLAFTRPVADIRVGILTIREKWERYLQTKTSTLTEEYLSKKFPILVEKDNIFINGSVFPEPGLVKEIVDLKPGNALLKDKMVVAARTDKLIHPDEEAFDENSIVQFEAPVHQVRHNWEIFSMNGQALKDDFSLLTNGRSTASLSKTNRIIGDPEMIFLEDGAVAEHAYLNTTGGPIYIGKDATVMEGAKVRGPFALCHDATLKMDAKVYEDTTIGPHCKVGGEVQNTVFFGYANKAHDGYLGNAVIGEWCNLGADTNNSNLKNTYDIVKLWSYTERKFVTTGLQFCGLIMGDHSKSGINTMFNTGTVVGVSCNLYGAGFQRNFIPSFSWGSPVALKEYDLNKAFEVASAVMKRRGLEFDSTEKDIFRKVLERSIGERR